MTTTSMPPRPPSAPSDPSPVLTPTRSVGVTVLLVVYVWLLWVLPARLTFAGMGGVGQPALMLAILLTLMWILARVLGAQPLDRAPNPMRWALIAYGGFVVINFAVLQVRPQTELESTASVRALMVQLLVIGVAVAVIDGLPSRAALDRVVRAVVQGGVACASVALVQFGTGFDPAEFLQLPGVLEFSTERGGVLGRGDLNRPRGTTAHPIELGVVVGAILPLALHRARYAARRPGWAWLSVVVIASGSVVSISRSGVLAILVGMGLLALVWDWRTRFNAAIASVIFVGLSWIAIPGLLGTFRYLFSRLDTDPSAQARIERFPAAFEVWSEAPWFGRGIGTFTVEEGLLLDQQFYQSAIEMGLVGLTLQLLLVATAAALTIDLLRRRSVPAIDRHLATAILGVIAALTVTGATYTSFHYRVHISLLFLCFGLIASLWRRTSVDAVLPVNVFPRK